MRRALGWMISLLIVFTGLIGPTPARLLCPCTGETREVSVSECAVSTSQGNAGFAAPSCCKILPGEERSAPQTLVPSVVCAAIPRLAPIVPLPALAPASVCVAPSPTLPALRGPPPGAASPRAPPV